MEKIYAFLQEFNTLDDKHKQSYNYVYDELIKHLNRGKITGDYNNNKPACMEYNTLKDYIATYESSVTMNISANRTKYKHSICSNCNVEMIYHDGWIKCPICGRGTRYDKVMDDNANRQHSIKQLDKLFGTNYKDTKYSRYSNVINLWIQDKRYVKHYIDLFDIKVYPKMTLILSNNKRNIDVDIVQMNYVKSTFTPENKTSFIKHLASVLDVMLVDDNWYNTPWIIPPNTQQYVLLIDAFVKYVKHPCAALYVPWGEFMNIEPYQFYSEYTTVMINVFNVHIKPLDKIDKDNVLAIYVEFSEFYKRNTNKNNSPLLPVVMSFIFELPVYNKYKYILNYIIVKQYQTISKIRDEWNIYLRDYKLYKAISQVMN